MAAEAKGQIELKDFKSLFSLADKVVLVTGGSRGLGLHAASAYVNTLHWLACDADWSIRPVASSKQAVLKST